MNKQLVKRDGEIIARGIEWCDYTWNPVGGCQHRCRWQMPDGKVAVCYAETTSKGIAQKYFANGWETHYFWESKLEQPLKLKTPARIFLDSMSDLMGHWVPDEQIKAVLEICGRAKQHTFLLLTKNAPRLRLWHFPSNVQVGVSTPPDFMNGTRLLPAQKNAMLKIALSVLGDVDVPVRWVSVEPLSWDVAPLFEAMPPVQWAVLGAASNAGVYHQPDPLHVINLLDVLDRQSVPVFFKGNLQWSPHREWLPGFAATQWNEAVPFPEEKPVG